MSRPYRFIKRQPGKDEPRGEVRPLFPNGVKCPRGCGATFNQADKVGMLLHNCGAWGTKAAMRGDRRTRSSVA